MAGPSRDERQKTPDRKDARKLLRKEDGTGPKLDLGFLKDPGAGGAPPEPPRDRHRLLLARLETPGQGADRASLLTGLQQTYGNRYVQRLLDDTTDQGAVKPLQPTIPTGDGRPLDKPVRDEMEGRFGRSFGEVKIHTDAAAAAATRALGARALTTGQDVYFGPGAYQPETPAGRGLIAHELAHTLQQGRSQPAKPQGLDIAPADDPLEQQAEAAATAIRRGAKPGPLTAATISSSSTRTALLVQRQPSAAAAPGPVGPDPQGFFVIGLGGLKIKQEEISKDKNKGLYRKDVPNLSLPGLKLKTLVFNLQRTTGEVKDGRVDASLEIPFVKLPDRGTPKIAIDKEGKASFAAKGKLDLAALNYPQFDLALKEGEIAAEATITADKLKPPGIPRLKIPQAQVTVGVAKGKLYGGGQVALEYPGLAKGDFSVAFKDGQPSGQGTLELIPDYLKGTAATLEIAEGKLKGEVSLPAAKLAPPVPGLKITDGTIAVGLENGKLSGKGENIAFAYQSLGTGVLNFAIRREQLEGGGSLEIAIPGLTPVKGQIRYAAGRLSGQATITPNKFPKGLPIRGGSLTVLLNDQGEIGGKGSVLIDLLGVGKGEFKFGYEKGIADISAEVELRKIPGLETGRVLIGVRDGTLRGEGEIALAPKQIPGLTGNLVVIYQDDRFSGKAKLGYAKDKFSGNVELFLNQDEKGKMLLSGSGEVTARLTDWLTGMVHIEVLPDATTKIAGELRADDIKLFPEKKADRELFSISQNIPLWAILVAVIRLRGGVRAGVGPGLLRGVTAKGEFSTAAEETPSFSVTGEIFIPAYAEAYIAFGAGLGLDVVIGSLTGGIEAVGTAGIYGAVSVIPEIEYEGGNFSITGTATLAAGAKLKLGLQAWAEVEAFWITVWENEWKLAEWVWDVGPELALQAQMKYVFGRPEPPTFEFKTSDIDAKRLIQDAMPKDGPKGSGAREALQNRAEWKGKLKEQRKDPSTIPPELSEKQAKAPAPKAPPPKPARKSPPADLKAKDPAKLKEQAAKAIKDKAGPGKAKDLDKAQKEKQDKGWAELEKLVEKSRQTDPQDSKEIAQNLARLKGQYGFKTLTHRLEGDEWLVDAAMSPKKQLKIKAEKPDLPTKVVFDPPDSRRGGTRMVAHPLTKKHGAGSRPSDAGAPPIWSDVNQRRNDRRLYVLGHLLNQHLGGSGDTMENLTPITFSANATHYAQAEKDVKKAVDSDQQLIHYEVKVNYPSSRRPTPEYFIPPKGHPAEGDLAESLTVKWWKLKGTDISNLQPDGPPKGPLTVKNVPDYPQT